MKIRAFVMGCAVVLAVEAEAQFTSLFGDENTAWTLRVNEFAGIHTDSLVYGGDTIVDGMHFRKFNAFAAYGSGPWSGPWSDCVRFFGEDTVTGRVWFFTLFDPVPVVIMDLSLQVGDQFETLSQFGTTFEVIATYSDLFGRHTVEFDSPIPGLSEPENFKFIEGYGPNRGMAYADGNCASLDPYTLCHYKDGVVSGHAADLVLSSVCRIATGIADISSDEPGALWPNPVMDGFVHIAGLSNGAAPYHILDMAGRRRSSGTILPTQGMGRIELTSLTAGVYVLQVGSLKRFLRMIIH